jgi:hypothetical protein
MTDTVEVSRCTIKGCDGLIVPDITGRPICYMCGPRDMLPTFYGASLKSEAAMRIGMKVERIDGIDFGTPTSGMNSVMAGKKDDKGKLDWTLLPWYPLEEVVRVMQHGAKKYGRDNWLHVLDSKRRYTAAAARHLIAYLAGQKNDPESGYHHLAHAVCCMLFIIYNEGTDAIPTREL